MNSVRNIPDQIMWHDGMLLSPQHLQQAFGRQEELIQYHSQQISNYPFGFRVLNHDEASLLSGILKIESIECIFQDGLEFLFHSSNDTEELKIDLNSYKEEISKQPQFVYICVPKKKTKNSVINTQFSRYNSVKNDFYTFDENTGEDEISIPRLRANVKLLLENELNSNYTFLPIFYIQIENSFFKRSKFVPPCLKVLKNTILWELCHSVCVTLRLKIKDIIEDLPKFQNLSTKDHISERFLILKSIKECLPRFEVALYSEQLHPFQLYLELYSVMSKICANNYEELIPQVIEYNHFNILNCFEHIKRSINDFLEMEIPTNFKMTRIPKINDRFQLNFNPEQLSIDNSMCLLLGFKKSKQISREVFIDWIKSAIICEENNYSTFYERKILGYRRSLIDKYDDLIPQSHVSLAYITIDRLHSNNFTLVVSPSLNENLQNTPEEIILYSRKKISP